MRGVLIKGQGLCLHVTTDCTALGIILIIIFSIYSILIIIFSIYLNIILIIIFSIYSRFV